ncbi:hypothetical protein SpCBS45565_g08516 [Spizellomyces sp. 'palustris']|nr:hypothetical protein SpCBS45565_g08516 [Spizellomyces sp. 'palustris']
MFAKTLLRTARPARLVRGGDGQVSAWGPLNFAGDNWKGNGAVPFTTRSRTRFLVTFWVLSIVGFGLPFANTEMRVAPLREGVKKEYAEQAAGAVA